ncbi:HNH endonuclease [Mycolicibacterium sp. XJ870]
MTNYPAVLVLNASYEALDLVSWENAVVLIVKDKARIHQAHESGVVIHSEYLSVPLPAVVVLTHYVLVPYRELDEHSGASVTAVLRRDNNTCGYCGDFASTVDHIVPRSRGGANSWANLIAACLTCNQLKADSTPEEAGMRLLWSPRVPAREPVRQRRIWRELSTAV